MELAAPSAIPLSDPRLARCGFAKLQGEGIDYFVRKYEVTIGRTSKNSTLDLILGDSTTISRQHAMIRYNFESKCFELVVLGKNGVQVESRGEAHLYTPDSSPTPLRSRDLLSMGEKRFYFLLPRAMGGPARKRRRVEASPAPPPVGLAAAAAPSQAAAQALHAPQAPAHPSLQLHQQEHAPQVVQAAPPPAAGADQGVPCGLPAHTQAAPEVHDPLAQPHQHEPHPPHEHLYPGGGGGADEDDALINAGGPLAYDNGAPYGYGGDPNCFGGGF